MTMKVSIAANIINVTGNAIGIFLLHAEVAGVASWGDPTTPTFVNYVEGIYLGYKFYETAAAEGLIDYDKEVVYPFGYGLSYTTFTQEMGEPNRDLHLQPGGHGFLR